MALQGFFFVLFFSTTCYRAATRKHTTNPLHLNFPPGFYLTMLKRKIIKSHCCPLTRSSLNAVWFSFRFTTFPSRFLKENPVKYARNSCDKHTNTLVDKETLLADGVVQFSVQMLMLNHATVKRVVEKWSVICVPNTKSVPTVCGLATPLSEARQGGRQIVM